VTTLIVSPTALQGDDVVVEGDGYRHLFRAKRLAVGDTLRVVDGEGRARHGRITTVTRRAATVELQGEAASLEPAPRLELWVAPPRPQRASWLVEKATELGVHRVRFVLTSRTNRQWGEEVLARLERVARAAVEQCGRARIPAITGPHPWSEVTTLMAVTEFCYLLDPAAETPQGLPGQPLPGQATTSPTAVLIGPEGGWTQEERSTLRSAGCHDLCLGPRILRTETAAVAAAALWLERGLS